MVFRTLTFVGFEEDTRLSVQTPSEGLGKCKCNETTMYDVILAFYVLNCKLQTKMLEKSWISHCECTVHIS